MKKQYLIDLATSLAVWRGDTAPLLTSANAKCGSDLFLCYNVNNSMAFEADEVADFVQNKYRMAGQSLVVDPSWVEPIPIVPVIPVPEAVTMRQARLALLQAGSLSAVNSAIAGMTGAMGESARIEWEFSSEVKRNQPLVIALTPTLGFTPKQLDDLFILAAKL